MLEKSKLGSRPVPVRRFGEDLVLYRTESGEAYCFIDRCPHRGVALHLGRVVGEELECGYHGFRFRTDGACTAVPCDGESALIPRALRAQAFPTREEHGLVWVWWGAPRERLPPIPWIPDAPSAEARSYGASFTWPVPTFRAIEATFDYHHAPVLHGKRSLRWTNIPRMLQFDEVACEADGEGVELRGVLRVPGEPRRPGGPTLRCHTSFRMPGLSYIRIGELERILTVDTPIDAGSTFRFMRVASPIGGASGLGRLLAWLTWKVEYHLAT